MRAPHVLSVFLTGSLLLWAATVQGQAQVAVIDQVEEDWQLVVATPDTTGVGPQVTTCMSPVSDNSTPFAAFDLNYREYPNFQVGGMQIQVWSGENVLSTAGQGSSQFATANETVTWTQRMALNDGRLSYKVINGQSSTFGRFGQGSLLSVNYSTNIASLATYDPATSIAASGVSWESNLVTSMTLVQVRYYSSGQLIATDTTPRALSFSQ